MPIPLLQKIKNRKFLFFCLSLVLVSFFISYPNGSSADVGDVGWSVVKYMYNTFTWAPKKLAQFIWWAGGESAAKAAGNELASGTMSIIFSLATLVFGMAAGIFEAVYNLDILQQPMTRGNLPIAAVVLHGWAIVRDFANMFIVLGFVVIGLATILRIREYEAQKKLLPLIIVALLINFSLVITGIVIDASNITMRYFTQISGPTTIIQTYKNILASDGTADAIEKLINEAGKDEKAIVTVSVYGAMSILLGIVAMIFFIYGILFLFRYVALMCLVILSPLAFVCSVFPATRPIYEKWKSQFIQWAIIGIPTAFFVYLGTFLLISLSNNLTSDPANPLGVSIAFWVPTAFMLFAYSLIFQTSAIGASAAIGLATGAVGYAMGASRWAVGKGWGATKWAAGKAGAGRMGDTIKDTTTSALERLNLMDPGTTARKQRERLNEKGRDARINAMTTEEKLEELKKTRWSRGGQLDKAKIIESLAQNNQLDALSAANGFSATQKNALITGAMQEGVKPKVLIGGMQSADIADIINNPSAHPGYDAETRAEGFKTLSKRKHLDLINTGMRQTAVREAVQHGARPEEIEKADYRYARYNNTRLERIRTANPMFSSTQVENAAIEQSLDENITTMDHDQLRSIDASHLTAKRIDRLTPDKINAFQRASQSHRDAIKSHFDPADPTHELLNDLNTAWAEYNVALARGDQAAANNRYAEFRRLRTLYVTASGLP